MRHISTPNVRFGFILLSHRRPPKPLPLLRLLPALRLPPPTELPPPREALPNELEPRLLLPMLRDELLPMLRDELLPMLRDELLPMLRVLDPMLLLVLPKLVEPDETLRLLPADCMRDDEEEPEGVKVLRGEEVLPARDEEPKALELLLPDEVDGRVAVVLVLLLVLPNRSPALYTPSLRLEF